MLFFIASKFQHISTNFNLIKVNEMKALKSKIQLTALVLSFVFTNTVLAAESITTRSEDNGTANTISNTASPVAQADTTVSDQETSQPQSISDTQNYRKQNDERWQQVQKEQQEAYNRFLERRKQHLANNNSAFNNNVPAHVQERHNEFMKQMEERRALNIKMMEEHRKAAAERRETMQLKMHKTDNTPELDKKA
jgi:hypothetical protein